MNWDDFELAHMQAKQTLAQADQIANSMASMLRHRLRAANISSYVLADMKKELRNFNAHTGRWID